MSTLPKYTKYEIVNIFESILDKTLGEVDVMNEFNRTLNSPKITGIAGDVIEVSVLKKEKDNKQEADIIIDGQLTEVKTTGLRMSVKKENTFEAKEPMSITAVSMAKIVKEDFFDSNFFEKVEHMLIVYYFYDSKETVKAADYANFELRGYQLLNLEGEDLELVKNDWETVRDFIRFLHENYEQPENEYPRISSELRPKLLVLDTAPKYPNSPRFRFKRNFVNTIVSDHFEDKLHQSRLTDGELYSIKEESSEYEKKSELQLKYSSYEELDSILSMLTRQYEGWTVEQLADYFEIPMTGKSLGEQIIVRMFGGDAKKINDIELFRKTGIQAKTVRLGVRGKPVEDTKLFQIEFDEIADRELEFEKSQFFQYFDENQILFIVFSHSKSKEAMRYAKFEGFVRYTFEEEYIDGVISKIWNHTRSLVFDDKLKNIIQYKGDNPIINKNGETSVAPNFMKSTESEIFIRGSGEDSSKKPEVINGIEMYRQYVWMKKNLVKEIIGKKEN